MTSIELRDAPLDRAVLFILRVVLGLVLFPIVTFVAVLAVDGLLYAVLSEKHWEAVLSFSWIISVIIGLMASIIFAWASAPLFRRVLNLARSKFPEPIPSCLQFGILGGVCFGGTMLAVILLLGHMRPEGFEIVMVPPAGALGFVIFAIGGLPVGLRRRRSKEGGT